MIEEIQEKLQEYYENFEIQVEYVDTNKYRIIILKRNDILKYNCSLKNKNKHDIIKRSVTFEYKWNKEITYNRNIDCIKSSIDKYFKLYLESEEEYENK